MLVSEKADERGKEGEVTKCLFVVPGAVENHISQCREALRQSWSQPRNSFHFNSVSAQRYHLS